MSGVVFSFLYWKRLLVTHRFDWLPDYFLIGHLGNRGVSDHIAFAIQNLRHCSTKRTAIQHRENGLPFICPLNEVKILNQIYL